MNVVRGQHWTPWRQACEYVRQKHAEDSERVTDYVLMTLRGLSSYACLDYSTQRLTECARLAGRALKDDFLAQAAKIAA